MCVFIDIFMKIIVVSLNGQQFFIFIQLSYDALMLKRVVLIIIIIIFP